MAYNHIVILGRLTHEPSTNQTTNGTACTKISLAVDRGFGEDKKTDFIPVVFFGKTAESIAKYVGKGQQILASGRLQTGSYEDKNGNKRTTFEVFATEFSFCETKRDSSTNFTVVEKNRTQAKISDLEPIEDNDLPF